MSEPVTALKGDKSGGSTDRPWLASYPEGLDWHSAPTGGTLHGLLEEAAARHPDAPAMNFMGARLTYRELAGQVDRAAAGLQKLGLEKGMRVALMLPNCPFYPIYYYAIAKAGGIIVNCNPLYAERELARLCRATTPTFLVTVDLKALLDKVLAVLDETALKGIILCDFASSLPALKRLAFRLVKGGEIRRPAASESRIIPHRQLMRASAALQPVPIDPAGDCVLFQFTGGTTGTPKVACLTHANLTINAAQCLAWLGDARQGEERMMAVIPFFHVFANTVALNLAVMIAAEIIALPRFELKALLQAIHRQRPTLFPAVPTIYTAINNAPDLERYDLTSIRLCISGGAALPAEVRTRFEGLTGCRLLEGYGLTETAPVAICQPVTGEVRDGAIGLPIPATDVRIVDPDDRVTVRGPGERGEICIRGPQVMQGYWEAPEETAQALVDGWFHTGDIGTMDEDGYFFIVDRIKDLILAGGYNVYPRMVEEAIYQHPAVEECIVAGVPDAYRGETVKAWIKLREGEELTAENLREFLREHLSAIEIPKQIEFRAEPLPKTMIGKLSRKDVVAQHEAASDAPADKVAS